MIKVGSDICNPDRIAKTYQKFGTKFLKRILSEAELEQIKNSKNFILRLAARYAAKEAVAKMLGTGIGEQVSFKDIEILRQESDKPKAILKNGALKKAHTLGINSWDLSISHERNMVIAFCAAI